MFFCPFSARRWSVVNVCATRRQRQRRHLSCVAYFSAQKAFGKVPEARLQKLLLGVIVEQEAGAEAEAEAGDWSSKVRISFRFILIKLFVFWLH